MNIEESIRPKVKKYLIGLGYPPDSVLFEYLTSQSNRVDAIVRIGDRILVACEIKSQFSFQYISEIGYDPIARKLQKEAGELSAEYFFITNGVTHLWLKSGSSGRPEVVDEVRFSSLVSPMNESYSFTIEKLNRVADFIRSNPLTGDYLFDLSVVLYSRLIEENGADLIFQNEVRNLLRDSVLWGKRDSDLNTRIGYILEGIHLIDDKTTVLKFIDESFESRRSEWYVPRWLGDFMAKLLSIEQTDLTIDLFARNGILTASANLNGANRTISLYNSDRDKYWILIHQFLTSNVIGDVRFEPALLNAPFLSVPEGTADRILIAPPFNIKLESFSGYDYRVSVNDSTAILTEIAFKALKKGGRLIVIVPDGFLSSGQFRKARTYFKSAGHIESIISLPSNTFHPFSSIKTSLLTIRNANNGLGCFFASVEGAPKRATIDITNSSELNQIIQNISRFRANEIFDSSNLGFVVHNLDTENFHYSKYWFELNYHNINPNVAGITTVPLREIIFKISRGGQLVESKRSGDVAFVGPASVRKMQIIKESLSYSSKSKIPNHVTRTERDDILVNCIGNHRGSAAIVDGDFIDLPINRHIIQIKPNRNLVLPGYLAIVLNSEFVSEQFLDRSSGIIPSLNLKSFDNIYIPLPSLEKQQSIFREFRQLLDKVNQVEHSLLDLRKTLAQKFSDLGKEGTSL